MINLAHSEEEKKEMKDSLLSEAPRYPYGLEISLDDEVEEKTLCVIVGYGNISQTETAIWPENKLRFDKLSLVD